MAPAATRHGNPAPKYRQQSRRRLTPSCLAVAGAVAVLLAGVAWGVRQASKAARSSIDDRLEVIAKEFAKEDLEEQAEYFIRTHAHARQALEYIREELWSSFQTKWYDAGQAGRAEHLQAMFVRMHYDEMFKKRGIDEAGPMINDFRSPKMSNDKREFQILLGKLLLKEESAKYQDSHLDRVRELHHKAVEAGDNVQAELYDLQIMLHLQLRTNILIRSTLTLIYEVLGTLGQVEVQTRNLLWGMTKREGT
eukprot:jgi/Tetstr1/460205/TSEL_005520.t1